MARNKNKPAKEPKASRFRLALVNDDTHEHIWTLRFTRWTFFLTVISIVTSLLVLALCLVAFTPLRTFVPGYPDAQARRAAARDARAIDSLEGVIGRWEFYSENLRKVVAGENPVVIDSLIRNYLSPDESPVDREYLVGQDSVLRQTVREAERFRLSSARSRELPLEGMHFFTPIKGVVSRGYETLVHPYIDISAPLGSVVMSVMDGTVVSASWSDEYGYSLVIQHPDNIISIYRHNSKLLKKEGDKVSAGASVALSGNTASVQDASHLRFELWYRGEAVDPVKYITF